jgi:spore germination protein GerM
MSSRLRAVVAVVGALLLTSALVNGCGDDSESPTSPTTSASTSSTTAVASAGDVVASYFFRAEKLAVVARALRDVDDGDDVSPIEGALGALVGGPTASEIDAGFATQVPPGTEVRGVTVADGVATVDLSSQFAADGSTSMLPRVAQVTFTVTQFSGVGAVKFRLDGRDVKTIGDAKVDPPVTRADFEALQPTILVDSPGYGAQVTRTFTARGTSNTFEATHVLQVLGADGSKLVDTPVTATSGTGTRGTWQTAVSLPDGVAGAVTLRVFEESAADGSETHVVDVALTVKP